MPTAFWVQNVNEAIVVHIYKDEIMRATRLERVIYQPRICLVIKIPSAVIYQYLKNTERRQVMPNLR
jgi:hypothetical protein